MTTVSVVTPAIPERFDLLAEALESVAKQNVPPLEHIVVVDYERVGTAKTLNKALFASHGEWIAVLADDDVLYPNHIEACLKAAEMGVDVIYPACDCDWDLPQINRPFNGPELARQNYIPATTLIRRSTLLNLGGWPNEREEDWALWLRIHVAGGRFVYVPEVTWHYRVHERPQKSRLEL